MRHSNNHLAIGLNSGTSADGISAVLGNFKGKFFKVLGSISVHYPRPVFEKIRKGADLSVGELSELNVQLGLLFAKAALQLLKKCHVNPSRIECIGSHGQTIYHGPDDLFPNTMQIGDPDVIAQKTGIPVVSHFRQADIAAGGQGAPLIPFFDQYFYGHSAPLALLNIGGIANVTLVGRSIDTFAFDMGPGNGLMDLAIQKLTQNKEPFDKGGRMAKQGQMDMVAISQMMEHPYFSKPIPKSTGFETFGPSFLNQYIPPDLWHRPNDLLATLNYFTCISIQEGFRSFVFDKIKIEKIVVSGGGVYNKTMINKLECLFAPIEIMSIERTGVAAQDKEPLAFAFFALRRMHKQINHIPQCTGAKKACVLGRVTPP